MAVVAEELIADLIVRDNKLKSGLASAKQTFTKTIREMRSEAEKAAQIVVDDRKLKPGLAGARQIFSTFVKDLRGDGERLERDLNKNTQNIGSGFGRLFAGLLAGVGIKQLVSGFLEFADTAKQIDAQLRLATAAVGSFGQAQQDVTRIAQESRTGLKETADLYGVFMRNARELGITQEQAARSTETISKAFQISGASAAEAAGGMRQFLQGIQSGVLRGEELNSVLENAPRLARALADGLGVSIGQLRLMGSEGELTGERVIAALEGAASSIDAEFRELPVTFDQAMTTLYNAATVTFGAFDEGGEFSTALANFIMQGSTGFEDMGERAKEFGIDVRSTFAGLSDVFEPLVNAAFEAFGLIGSEAKSLADRIRPLLGEIDAITRFVAGDAGSNLLGRFNEAQARSESGLRRRAGERFVADLNRRRDAMGNLIDQGPAPSPGGASSGGARRTGGRARAARVERSPLRPEAFAREEAQLNDRILSLKSKEADTVEGRARAELERLTQAQTALAAEIQADKRFTQSQKDKLVALSGTVSAMQQAEVVVKRDLETAKQLAEANETNLRYHIDALDSVAQSARTRQEQLAAERRILDALEQRERAELESAINAGRVADPNRARADLGTTQANRRGSIERGLQSPLEQLRDEARMTADEVNDAMEDIQARGLNSLGDGITDAITGVRSLGDVFRDVANQIISDLIRIAVQRSVVGGLAGIFGGGGLDLGFLGGNTASDIGARSLAMLGGRAGGGPVSAGSIYRVNEGQNEYFQPATSGTIIPLSATAQAARPGGGAAGAPIIVQLAVGPGQLFEPTVQAISGDVSIRTVQAAAPGIVKAAGVEITRRSGRPRV